MKKKILVVLLACMMVFAFSAVALGADVTAGTPYLSKTEGGTALSTPYELDSSDFYVNVLVTHGNQPMDQPILSSVLIEATAGSNVTFTPDVKHTNKSDTQTLYSQKFTITGSEGEKSASFTFKIGGDTKATLNNVELYYGDNRNVLKSFNLGVAAPSNLGNSSISTTSFDGGNSGVPKNMIVYVDKAVTAISLSGIDATSSLGLSATKVYKSGSKDAETNLNNITLSSSSKTEFVIAVSAQNGLVNEYKLTVHKSYDDTSLKVDDEGAKGTKNTISCTYPKGIRAGKAVELILTIGQDADLDIDFSDKLLDTVTEITKDGKRYLKVVFDTAPDGDTVEIYLTVTSQNGDDAEYRLVLTEGTSTSSTDAVLSGLDISIAKSSNSIKYNMYPSKFDADTTDYYVFVPYNTSHKSSVDVYLKARFGSKVDEVKVAGTTVDSGDNENVGYVKTGEDDKFNIKVTSGSDSQTYTVHVYYADDDANRDAYLDGFTVKYGSSYNTTATLTPAFAQKTYSYTAVLPSGTKSARLTLDLDTSDNSVVYVDGDLHSKDGHSDITDLKAGKNEVEIVVIAEDCSTINTYKVNLNVGGTAAGTLSYLNFGNVSFSPQFTTSTYNYVGHVPSTTTVVNITATGGSNISIVNKTRNSTSAAITATSGQAASVTLADGLNEIMVTADGVTYTLNVYRHYALPTYNISTQTLVVDGVTKTMTAVNINGNNFLKLRDLADVLSGTTKQFNTNYTQVAGTFGTTNIYSKTAYVPDASNPVHQPIVLRNQQQSKQSFLLDGRVAYPVAYNVNASNYVNMRQVCAMLDIGLTYNATTDTITIDTAEGYVPGQ